MLDKELSATAAARNFSDVLDQVQHKQAEFSIRRGKQVIARIVPPAKQGMSLSDLQQFINLHSPGMTKAEAERELKQLRALRRRLAKPRKTALKWD